MVQVARIIGTGLATTGLIGAWVGIGAGAVFGALILGVGVLVLVLMALIKNSQPKEKFINIRKLINNEALFNNFQSNFKLNKLIGSKWSNNSRSFSTIRNNEKINTKLKKDKNYLFFLDISKLYFIKKEYINKLFLHILSILAILFLIVLFITIFKLKRDLFFFFNYSAFLLSLIMGFLIYKDYKKAIQLSKSSLHLISNILLLSLILAIVIYISVHLSSFFMSINHISFKNSWYLARNMLGLLLGLKIIFNFVKVIYFNRKNTDILINQLIQLVLSLMVLSFFYSILFFIFNILDIIIIENTFNETNKTTSKIQSEAEIESTSKSSGSDVSLNHHFTKYYPTIVNAKGHYLYSDDGREIFDAASGAGVACIGYGNDQVIDKITLKYKAGNHYLASSYWKDEDVLKLSKVLVDSTGGKLPGVYFTGSGSDAIEATWKLVRQYFYDQDNKTEKEYIISRERSYHGNTLAALSISEFSARQIPYVPLLSDKVEHVSSCYPYRQLIDGESTEEFVIRKATELENKIQEIGPNKVAAFIMEPVVGSANGAVPYVTGYIEAMRDVCHKHNVLFILDEVMCGMGRTGTLHAWQAEGVVPDILIIGKALGAGYHPMAAILVSPIVLEGIKSEQFIHGLTFDSNPVGATAALEVSNFIQDKNLIDNVYKQGILLQQSLKAELGNHKNVGEIRGIGLMWGIELVKDKITKEPFDSKLSLTQKIVDTAKLPPYNMTFYPSTGFVDGVHGDCIIIMPPYTITSTDVNHIVDVLSRVVNKVLTETNVNR